MSQDQGRRPQDQRPPQRGNQQQTGQHGQQPPQQSPQQGRQQPPQQGGQPRQGQQPPPGPPGGGPGRGGAPDDSGGRDLGRRKFLLGGAGVAALGAGGGWWFFFRGPSGAKGVVADAYEALDSNDWERFESVFHEDATLIQQIEQREGIDSYEAYLEDFDALDRAEAARYDVRGLHEMRHETDPDPETVPQLDSISDVAEFKEILVIVEEDLSGWDELDEDADPVSVLDNTLPVVQTVSDEWKLL